jgi:GNAT superfamily N-acetyltransferase
MLAATDTYGRKTRTMLIGSSKKIRVRIRRARLSDAEPIAALATQLGYPSSSSEVKSRLARIKDNDNHMISVAQVGATVVGWVHAFVKHSIDAEPRAEIAGLVVDESCRRFGIGKLLMQHAEEWARAKRLGAVYLRSNVLRDQAHPFYEALGYRRIKTQHCYLKTVASG